MPVVSVDNAGEGVALVVLLVAIVFLGVLRRLQRTRPGFAVGQAIAVAYSIRLLSIVGINATGLGASLRGGDEETFLRWAQFLAHQPLGHGDLPHGIYQLQTVLFALQIKLGFINVSGMRVTQIGIALLGYIFMLAATYDLAGPKATRVAAWCLAFEPASIFFNSEIHRESLLELAAGLSAFGGVWVWKRLDIRGILISGLGCLIAIETRSYAGWFMVAGLALLILHASLRDTARKAGRKGTALTLIYAVVIAALIATPTLLAATGNSALKRLQTSDSVNASGAGEGGTGGANGSNLALETVNISSRTAVVASLPKKVRELLLEPYPWQLHDASEVFGALGTLIAYLIIGLVIRYAWICRGSIFARAGPLIYPLLFELIAYSITVGNAGTGFRYRSHLVTLGICVMAILRQAAQERATLKRESTGIEPYAVAPEAGNPLTTVTA